MSDLEITHPVPVEAVAPWVRSFTTTFLEDPHGDDLTSSVDAWTRTWQADRAWGVQDRGRWVASLATQARVLAVPGPGWSTLDLPVDAVTAVAVAATHRRQGLLTRMIAQSLQAADDRGDAVSILIAAEWPIYGRYGFAPATTSARYHCFPRQAGRLRAGDPSRVRQISRTELGDIAPGLFDRVRRQRAGQIDRPGPWWQRSLGLAPYAATPGVNWFVHDAAGGPDGFLGWRATRSFDLNGPLAVLEVQGPYAENDDAYCDLWAYLLGIDGVGHLDLDTRPVDEPARWLMNDGRALKQVDAVDFLWLRILDVAAALSARRYASEGSLVLEVTDEHVGAYAAGRFRLSAGPVTTCERTDQPVDLVISQSLLASIFLGGHRLRALAVTGGLSERTPGSVQLLDAMFATPSAPWTGTWF